MNPHKKLFFFFLLEKKKFLHFPQAKNYFIKNNKFLGQTEKAGRQSFARPHGSLRPTHQRRRHSASMHQNY